MEKTNNHYWNLLACYGTPYEGEKKYLWENLERVVSNCEKPWLVIGNLNEVVDESEKQGGKPVWKKQLILKPFLNEIGGIDMGFLGSRFTWSNGCASLASIKEMIDRAVADQMWISMYPKAII